MTKRIGRNLKAAFDRRYRYIYLAATDRSCCLDRRVHIQVAELVLDTQIATLQAHLKGLQGMKKVLSAAQG